MFAEPITLFARTANPSGVARLLRQLAPGTTFDGPDDIWHIAEVTLAAGTVTFTHDPEYYAEPNWSVQMKGMEGYFSRLPETHRKIMAMMLPTTFKFSLGLRLDPMDFIGVTEASFGNYDRTAWFSSQEVAQLPLVEGDLAISGARLDKASLDNLSIARSIAHERHRAANWLCNGPAKYSATDAST